MTEFLKIFIESNVSPSLKVIIVLFFLGGAVWNVFRGISFISALIFDYKYTKKLRELDKYVDFSHHK